MGGKLQKSKNKGRGTLRTTTANFHVNFSSLQFVFFLQFTENNRENGETVKEALSPLTELEDAHKLE